MGLFKRKKRDGDDEGPQAAQIDLDALISRGEDRISQLGEVHADRWGLGSAQRWSLDLEAGTITWSFPERTATAPVQILGSYNVAGSSWRWAWSLVDLNTAVRRDAHRIREWALQQQADILTTAVLELDEAGVATVAALSATLTDAAGFYRAQSGKNHFFLTFGPVTITEADGSSAIFTIEMADEDDFD